MAADAFGPNCTLVSPNGATMRRIDNAPPTGQSTCQTSAAQVDAAITTDPSRSLAAYRSHRSHVTLAIVSQNGALV